ncbi:uncharacterized protein LOC123553359 isoform X2 [Mercenaria mercenaria]|uniref:uncharacterized protein LOC123553359 isoform X2 n=1 Tax=Mercenaria mercenaria TaxID=6596 RepID=UPI00234EBFD9|nr:uncharacterized protein LOC123553359 isoform X2 [Mercenaria mercenaria]
MVSKETIKTITVLLISCHGIHSEPHCSKFDYEEKLLEKMVRLEFLVENMKKEMKILKNEASTTLGNLQTERKTWENTLMDMKDTSEKELNKLADAKEALTKEITESFKRPEVAFSARNPSETSLTDGQTMVFTEIILNKGDGYNKEDGVFTVPYTGIYMFTVQWCLYGSKAFYFDFVANEVPFQMTYVYRKNSGYCYSFDALTAVNKHDSVKIKIRSPYSGSVLIKSPTNHWNTFSGVLI